MAKCSQKCSAANRKHETACNRHITRSAKDREKAELLGEAQAQAETYKASDAYKTTAASNANKLAKFFKAKPQKGKEKGKGISSQVPRMNSAA